MSTASERVQSHSGSESHSDTPFNAFQYAFDSDGQDVSPQLPRSSQPSDSDCATPQSQGAQMRDDAPGTAEWEASLKSEITRVELGRNRVMRRPEIGQSPGGAAPVGNFREAMGMSGTGPVAAPPYGYAPLPRRGAASPGGSGSHSRSGSRGRGMKVLDKGSSA